MSDSFEENVTEAVTSNHQSTNNSNTQVGDDSHDKGAPTEPDNWVGDSRYFQSGKKAGQLKPSAAAKSKVFGGLAFDTLKPTDSVNDNIVNAADVKSKKEQKQEKKIVEAKIYAKLAMRFLDTIVGYISGGTYGADFTEPQRKERNKYREELEEDWQDYLVTLDISAHPSIVVLFGSMIYIAPAFSTEKGEEKTKSIKEKIFGKIGVALFSRGKK